MYGKILTSKLNTAYVGSEVDVVGNFTCVPAYGMALARNAQDSQYTYGQILRAYDSAAMTAILREFEKVDTEINIVANPAGWETLTASNNLIGEDDGRPLWVNRGGLAGYQ